MKDGIVLTINAYGRPEYSHSISADFALLYDSQSPVMQTSSGATYAVCTGETQNKILVKIEQGSNNLTFSKLAEMDASLLESVENE